jgi:hypothetical protein
MRTHRTTLRLFVATAAGILTLAVAMPALAATPATFEVTAGGLSISAPGATADLGTRANTVDGGTVSGPLGQVQVSDARSAGAGSAWTASVISTAFGAVPASAVAYTAGTITKVGTAAYAANDPTHLEGVIPAVSATGITGDNSATWNPTITVTIPGGTPAGTYNATITHSVI